MQKKPKTTQGRVDKVAVGVHMGLYRNAEVWQDVAVCHDSSAWVAARLNVFLIAVRRNHHATGSLKHATGYVGIGWKTCVTRY